jgi:flagellar biosynthetic protein FliO
MSNASTFELFARLAFSLAIVIGLMWLAARVMRRRGFGGAPGRSARKVDLELIARQPVGRNASIAVIRTGSQALVVGITEQHITKLAETDFEEVVLEDATAQWTEQSQGAPKPGVGPGSTWKTMLEQMRERTTRR